MATPPAKPPAPPPKPAPVEEKMQVNIHGIPPKPNMEDLPEPIEEQHLSPITRAELEAGRKGLELNKARLNAELEAGRKAVAEAQARLSNSQSGEEKPSQP